MLDQLICADPNVESIQERKTRVEPLETEFNLQMQTEQRKQPWIIPGTSQDTQKQCLFSRLDRGHLIFGQ